MEGGNYRATCFARDSGRSIGMVVAEFQTACEEGISRMLEERRYWGPRT